MDATGSQMRNRAMTDDPSHRHARTQAVDAGGPARARRSRSAPAGRAGKASRRPKEFQGPKGPEPTRYGDWENKGIASDF